MKRVFTFALALALLLSLAIPAAAATRSVAATPENLLPELVTATCDKLLLYTPDEFDQLPDEVRETIGAGMEALPDAIPEGMGARLVFYADICDECEDCSAVFMPSHGWEPMVIQYVDGQWVELEVIVNEDGTITVNAITDGLMVFLTGTKPTLVSSSCEHAVVYAESEMEGMAWKIRNMMNAAKRAIDKIPQEGMLVRYFFYADICENCASAEATFQAGDFNELVIMQYVDGAWTELEFTDNGDGTVAVAGVIDGPMVFLVN